MPLALLLGSEDISQSLEDARFTASINGGFAGANLSLEGDAKPPPLLTNVSLSFEGVLVWEGFVSESTRKLEQGRVTTDLACQGYQRILDWTKVLAPFSIREIAWNQSGVGNGQAFMSGVTFNYRPTARGQITIGQFDEADTTKRGIKFAGDGEAMGNSDGVGVEFTLPFALTEAGTFKATATLSGAGVGAGLAQMSLFTAYSANGTSWTATNTTASGNVSVTLPVGTQYVRVGWRAGTTGLTPAGTDYIEVKSIRILGTALTEDDTATANQEGFYPSSLITNIIGRQAILKAEIPSIKDVILSSFGSLQYKSLRELLTELFSYCNGYWGIYENKTLKFSRAGRLSWLEDRDLISYSLRQSAEVDTQQVIVTYTDSTSKLQTSATANVDRSIFRGSAIRKQDVYSVGTMSSHSAGLLATQTAALRGARPQIAATVIVPGALIVPGIGPAVHIRPGDQISLVGISDLANNTLDVIEMSYSMRADTLELSLGYYDSTLDVLLARLANDQTAFTV